MSTKAARPGASSPSSSRQARPLELNRSQPQATASEQLADACVEIAESAWRAYDERRWRVDRSLSHHLRRRLELSSADHRAISEAVFALFRWKGWVDGMNLSRMEHRLLVASLLDTPTITPLCRVWARRLGFENNRLIALGDAPSWTARGESLRRVLDGRPFGADPWRLFPTWLREVLLVPPGDQPLKARYLELLNVLQTRPKLWVRVQSDAPDKVWNELREQGVKPWIHRRLTHAARIETAEDVYQLPLFQRGDLEIQDLASQAVGHVCDPDPGERWWDVCAGAGGKALHLAGLMRGKGLVVATDIHAERLKEAVRRARRSPFRNITTKLWDEQHVAGKTASFHGVLVDAPCSGIGTWRRNPEARWLTERDAVPRLAALQARILKAAAPGVRPGGTLVYSVCTLTPLETRDVVRTFLADHPQFRLDNFPHPFNGEIVSGQLEIWPGEADTDGMFIARFRRATSA